ncbi:FxsA family protein [Aliiruegeria sabulilitoris]|uniref:FxsA family protein n=1 Tax=Aliiruegeria sabulilitoris TaxID=1510458 RepID=UPI00082B7627|nr:FxsA family protein [Aliiruegeria sabulilitoris]NDR57546.1 FxsA family protein [Pseudoruegeria sp. M32A2M]
MPLLLLFIAIPLIEIALFIQLGSFLGLGWTLFIVVLTAVIGTWLVKQQGMRVLMDVQNSFNDLNDPTEPLAHGAMILFSGALLLTPGFFTDTVGFLLLIPKVREAMFRYIRSRIVVHSSATMTSAGFRSRPRRTGEDVIDGEYNEIPEEPRRTSGPSGWTQD